jgi:hypothetical protein
MHSKFEWLNSERLVQKREQQSFWLFITKTSKASAFKSLEHKLRHEKTRRSGFSNQVQQEGAAEVLA